MMPGLDLSDSSPIVVVLSAAGTVIVAILGYLGMRINARNAKAAQTSTAELERSKIDAAAYDSAREIWDSVINDLRRQVADQHKELAALRTLVSKYHTEIGDLRDRIEDLETKRAGDRRAIHAITTYARQLLQLLKVNGIAPPPAPEGLALEDV
jgi:septal ring factor EnvC (AmiA/AmiB activator)